MYNTNALIVLRGSTIKKFLFANVLLIIFTSCTSFINRGTVEYKPVQYAKNDYRVLKKEVHDIKIINRMLTNNNFLIVEPLSTIKTLVLYNHVGI